MFYISYSHLFPVLGGLVILVTWWYVSVSQMP